MFAKFKNLLGFKESKKGSKIKNNISSDSDKEEAVKEDIHPSGNNSMACEAISHKLSEIAIVAEGLDGALQDIERRMEEPASKSPDSEVSFSFLLICDVNGSYHVSTVYNT